MLGTLMPEANEAFRLAYRPTEPAAANRSGSAALEEGSLPARRSVTVNTYDPVMMGHLIEASTSAF